MNLKRLLLLSLVLFALSPAAYALCQDCISVQCVIITPNGDSTVDGSACSATQGYGNVTYNNCRTVSGCTGCIGWSCVVKDPIDLELQVVSIEVMPEKPQVATQNPTEAR